MAHPEHHEHDGHHGHHIIPFRVYVTVFAVLIFLTITTVLTAEYVDLGPLNLPLAIAIAGVKAGLVILFFMALKYDTPINALVFSLGGIFVAIFLAFTLFDTSFRGFVDPDEAQTVIEMQRRDRALMERDSIITPQLRAQPLVYGEGDIIDAGVPSDSVEVDSVAAQP